ncbi:MAG: class I SAM-dependent methyltransferase [Deltaproteobacteria bacterium]|nr:class I SAM-dependent methyltransferase [Deltaproteobacteria bacterium]
MHDDRHGYPGMFNLYICNLCRHKTLDANFDANSIARLYNDYYPRSSFNLENYQPYTEATGIRAWLDGSRSAAFVWVPGNVRILDIGCGYGETLGYHQSRGCDAYGVEVDENIRRIAEKFGYKIHIGLFDPKIYPPDYFDYVTMDQVIEHVSDPIQTLKDIASILKPGGTLIIGTPNSNGLGSKILRNYWLHWHAPYHLHLFSRKSMALAANHAGLELIKERTITNSYWLHLQWCHLITYPELGKPSVYWSPNSNKTLIAHVFLKLINILNIFKINQLLTRIVDSQNLGDNYLFILKKP